ncbi:MAG: Uma2 family endonuclease [Pseudanabaenaceae cyanobacterium SKYGB_i_bin29]|nr:Uma2 family endonuclease [Pseudanabaenaceae cyanobacterium SKYGB_i_bin29]
MISTSSQTITLLEFLQLPETKPAREYIDGQIILKPMSQGKHSALQGGIVSVINADLKSKQIARAFPELRITFSAVSIVPDISIFLWQRIPRDENGEIANTFSLAPDWIIEILSPDQSQTKVMKKFYTVCTMAQLWAG